VAELVTSIPSRRLHRGQAARRLAVSAVALVLGCADAADDPVEDRADTSAPIIAYTVNYPLQYFAERIGGEHVEVVFPAPPDVDPAFWMPPPTTIAAFQEANLIIQNGAGYARWTDQASLPRGRRVNTSANFRDRWIALADDVSHGHGPQGAQNHTGTAHTTWLDPSLAKEQARAIGSALSSLRPAARADFETELRSLEADLDELDRALARALAPYSASPVLFSHPVYQYLARRYSLTGRSLHWEPAEMPDERAWNQFERSLPEPRPRVLFFEGEPHAQAAVRLSAMGIRIIVFEPVGNRPAQGDWLSAMRSNVARLAPPSAVKAIGQ
jgi:zinc transport system substrate-binding protein